jgi:hypothetical protein
MAVGTNGAQSPVAYVDRRMIGSGVILMAGGLLACLVGATVGMVATVNACRRYVADLEESPQVVVRRRWQQAKSATAAGVGAWRGYNP